MCRKIRRGVNPFRGLTLLGGNDFVEGGSNPPGSYDDTMLRYGSYIKFSFLLVQNFCKAL